MIYTEIEIGRDSKRRLHEFPNECPHCHNSITPIVLHAHNYERKTDVFFRCPNQRCQKSFIGYYNDATGYETFYTNQTSGGNFKTKDFAGVIINISQQFEVIYNQSLVAEQHGLLEICGVGYRKALEFLIKDYTCQENPVKRAIIEKQLLGQTIAEFVSDERIKSVAKRAVWLGNDETHYVRKWESKDLTDLKKLIDLTVHWIEMVELTKTFNDDMPG